VITCDGLLPEVTFQRMSADNVCKMNHDLPFSTM
jgi:hypothetical protein